MTVQTDKDEANRLSRKDRRLLWLSFWIALITGLVSGISAGLVVAGVVALANTAEVRYQFADDTINGCTVIIKNKSGVPAANLSGSIRFPETVARHEQSQDVFISSGRLLEGSAVFAGRNEVTLKCDLLPPRASYYIRVWYQKPATQKPTVELRTAVGGVDEE